MAFDVRNLKKGDLKEGFGFLSSFYNDVAPEMPYIEYGIKLDSSAEYLLSQESDIPEDALERQVLKQRPFLELTKDFLKSEKYSSKQLTSTYQEPILYAKPKRSISSLVRKGTKNALWFDLVNLDEIKIFFPGIEESPVCWADVNLKTLDIIAGYGRILNLVSR